MIYYLKGDLLESDCTILAHQANCKSVMGAGIAKSIKIKHPEVYEADRDYRLPAKERLGNFSFALTKDKKQLIFNLYGQYNPGKAWDEKEQKERYEKFKEAFEKMLKAVALAEQKGFPIKIGIPYRIASGLAGGDWDIILRIITDLSEQYKRDIYIYKFD